ncbi:rSAM-modified peptide [[Flexibacter] sp. ATCC 35103]|nr:rSAM-modified peptide [[Flexibacter] sp. ATCC 35103]
MTNQGLNFEVFENEKLSKSHQKTVRGGDDEPTKGNGNGNTQPATK